MKINGNLEVTGTSHINLPVLDSSSLTSNESGKIFLNEEFNLAFHNGTEVVTVLDNNNNNLSELIDTLGVEWVTENGSFSPTNLNTVLGDLLVEPLDGNSSLFDVITVLSEAVSSLPATVKKYTQAYTGDSTYNVEHNLGQLICSVTVSEGTALLPPSEYSVEYLSNTQLSITFNELRNVTVTVMA